MSFQIPPGAEWVLFVVKAKNCPACDSLKQTLSDIMMYIKTIYKHRIHIEEIIFEKKSSEYFDKTRYTLELNRYIAWFPAIILISSVAYEMCRNRSSTLLPCAVFNGIVHVDGFPYIERVPMTERQDLAMKQILEWLSRELALGPGLISPPPSSSHTEPSLAHIPDDSCAKMRVFARHDHSRIMTWRSRN